MAKTKIVYDITKAPPPSKKKTVEHRLIDILLEDRASAIAFMEDGLLWEELSNVKRKKYLEDAKERAWAQFEVSISKNNKLLKRLKDKK